MRNLKNILVLVVLMMSIAVQLSYAQEVFVKDGTLRLKYKGNEYEVKQYIDSWDVFKYYSLQYHSPNDDIPSAVVLVMDRDGKVVKEITNDAEHAPGIIPYYLDNDNGFQDLILIWEQGAHSQTAEVWLNKKNKDFVKVFEQFSDKNIGFLVKDGVPTLQFKKEYPISAINNNFPDKDWDFYQWNGKTFKLAR